MKNKINFLVKSLLLLLLLVASKVTAQQNITIKTYTYSSVFSYFFDVDVLDTVFGSVTIDGTVRTADFSPPSQVISSIPTTVAGFGGVQVVHLVALSFPPSVPQTDLSKAQADALIDYVKAGGILIANMEGTMVTGQNMTAHEYIAEALLCNAVSISSVTAAGTIGVILAPALHPGSGALMLTTNADAKTITTTGSYTTIKGLPSENIIYSNNATSTCANIEAVDYIIPAYPGITNSCGVKGMAIMSGENRGVFNAELRNDSGANKSYAQLLYDFLYNPSAMATRRGWTGGATNTNTTCPPTVVCKAGASAPTLTATTTSRSCPAAGASLSALVTGTAPTGSSIKWYVSTSFSATTEVANPLSVSPGTYYAAFYDSTLDCFSPASAPVTVTNTCCAGSQQIEITN